MGSVCRSKGSRKRERRMTGIRKTRRTVQAVPRAPLAISSIPAQRDLQNCCILSRLPMLLCQFRTSQPCLRSAQMDEKHLDDSPAADMNPRPAVRRRLNEREPDSGEQKAPSWMPVASSFLRRPAESKSPAESVSLVQSRRDMNLGPCRRKAKSRKRVTSAAMRCIWPWSRCALVVSSVFQSAASVLAQQTFSAK
jgi:hypothetical protein